jgi:hypothetical protein
MTALTALGAEAVTAGAQTAADPQAIVPVHAGPTVETEGHRNYAAWSRRAPQTCVCGSVSSFPCNCGARSVPGTGTAA